MRIENFYINPPSLTINISISEANAIIEAIRYEYKHSDEEDKMMHPIVFELIQALDTLAKIKDKSKQ